MTYLQCNDHVHYAMLGFLFWVSKVEKSWACHQIEEKKREYEFRQWSVAFCISLGKIDGGHIQFTMGSGC